MGGKSTYLRSAAHAVILAHVGCFLPALPGARVGLADAIFARVGASDDLSRHRSTFMSEMLEVGEILAGATARSVVVVDEVGRGTSVFDGLAISLAVLEELNACGARTLFASHFSELAVTALERQQGQQQQQPEGGGAGAAAVDPRPICALRMGWEEGGAGGSVNVTHRVALHPIHMEAPANASCEQGTLRTLLATSHGLQVARHADVPLRVIQRAEAVLGSLSSSGVPLAMARAVREAARTA